MVILAAALFTAFVLILMLVQPSRVIYLRLFSIPALCIVFTLCLVLLSSTAVKAALNGLNLWAGVVVPSLFPFFVSAEILNSTGFIRASGSLLEPVMRPFFNVPGCGSFALAMGVTSGYPVGAKLTCDFRSKGDLTRIEAERLLAFTNNSGPLFIVGAVGTGMYGSTQIGLLLLACHFFACLTVGFLFRFYKVSKTSSRQKTRTGKPGKNPLKEFKKKLLEGVGSTRTNFGTFLGDAIKNSAATMMAIGGFIVLFSVIISFLTETGIIETASDLFAKAFSPLGLDKNVFKGILSGLFEITTGSNLVSSINKLPLIILLPATSFIVGWAGLSVHFQVWSIAAKTDISIRPYLIGKMLQGVISALYTWFILKFFHFERMIQEPVLGGSIPAQSSWLKTFRSSFFTMSLILCIFFIFAIVRWYTAKNPARWKGNH